MTKWRERIAVALLLIISALFIAVRFLGHQYFPDNWSLTHWLYQPWWYNLLWTIVFITVSVLVYIKSSQIAAFFNSTLRRIAGLLVLLIVLILLQFDSILFAGANLRVAQFAQSEYIIHRWFEFGSSITVYALFELYKIISMAPNTAAVFAWKTLLWISVLLSLFGSILLTGELSRRLETRFWLFMIVFLGPNSLAFLGLMDPIITFIPVLIWFSLFALRAMKNRSMPALLMAWLIVLAGVFFHYLSAFLLPAAVYVTLQTTLRLKRWSILSILSSLLTLGLVAGGLYNLALSKMEFARIILLLDGKRPFVNYGLLSGEHLGDLIQIMLLVFPQVLAMLFLLATERRQGANFFIHGFAWIIFLSGLIALLMLDPLHGIVLDLPLFVVFLTGVGILSATAVRLSLDRAESSPRLPAMMAVLALFIPLSIAPVYSRISVADKYVHDFLEQNQDYVIPATLAMRDAYFFQKDFNNANRWEQSLTAKSQDYLGFVGAGQLAQRGEFDGALEELYRLKTKFPFWNQPRILLSEVQLHVRQFDRARAEIDTLLMFEPFNKKHHLNLNKYYLSTNKYSEALAASDNALNIFNNDKDFLIDKLTAYYGTGQIEQTDSLARELIRIDSTLPEPYMFKGLALERSGNKQLALREYEKFLELAPDSPDAPEIRKRLNAIVVGTAVTADTAGN
jgi:Flp pilus assembly protein TadD